MLHREAPRSLHRVVQVTSLCASSFIVTVERGELLFTAGQFVNLHLPGTDTSREYSLYSGESEEHLSFLIHEVPHGAFSPLLRNVAPGSAIFLDGPYDEMFTIHYPASPHLFLATGTGIAPFHSMVSTYPNLDYHIVHGIRSTQEQHECSHYTKGRYTPCITGGGGTSFCGRVTDWLRKNLPPGSTQIYLCGSSAMVFDCKDLLSERGVEAQRIVTEPFY